MKFTSKKAQSFYEKLSSLPIKDTKTSPRNTNKTKRFLVYDDKGRKEEILLTEREALFVEACLDMEGNGKRPYTLSECYAIAGYNLDSYFNNRSAINSIASIKAAAKKLYEAPKIARIINSIQEDLAAEYKIDKDWVLNEQVELYHSCKKNRNYTQAVRLLHDISYHVDVDSRVSNKLEIEQTVDYAKILQQAEGRTIEHDNVIELGIVNE